MITIIEFLSGILRFFPNTMIVTLLVAGIVTAKMSWIFVAIGGLVLAAIILIFQYIAGTLNLGKILDGVPGAAVVEACSLIPTATGIKYSAMPSMWMALTSFFASYVFINALNVYTAQSTQSKDALPVQQRKGVGMISMLAAILLFLFLLVPRFRTPCETLGGTIAGVTIGALGAWGWWTLLDACGSDVFPDIHGVMMGLKPGSLHTAPVACTPSLKT